MWVLIGLHASTAYSQADSVAKTEKKAKTTAGKALKAIENALTFKNFFHHSDSARLARRYIRWHQKLTRTNKDYRYVIEEDSTRPITPYVRDSDNDLKYEVLGWYPSWEEDLHSTLNYDLLSTIAYFSYEVNPKTGQLTIANKKDGTPADDSAIIEAAKAANKTVLLTITNFGNDNNRRFLTNSKAADTLISQLRMLLQEKGVDGVCVDFEGIKRSQRKNLSSFMTLLQQGINSETDQLPYLVYMTLPAVDWEKSMEFQALVPVVDRFTIMGYDYYGTTSKVAGPVAPIKSGKQWDPFNLTTSIDYYLAQQIPPSKLILALPFFGYIWDTKSGSKGSRVDHFAGARTYDYIKTKMSDSLTKTIPVQVDSISQSAYYSFIRQTDRGKRQFRQIWFDTDTTMMSKIQLIKDKKLAGMGIWALGYNKLRKNYWSVIDHTLCNRDTTCLVNALGGSESAALSGLTPTGDAALKQHVPWPPQAGDDTGTDAQAKPSFWETITDLNALLSKITSIKDILLLIMAFVVLFGGAGFLISMFKPDTRMFFFGGKAQMVYYASFVLLFLLVILRWDAIFLDSEVALFLGFLLGGIAIYFISRHLHRINRDLP